jgi:hypothetical protein
MNLMMAFAYWGYKYRATGDPVVLAAGKKGWQKVLKYHGVAVGA